MGLQAYRCAESHWPSSSLVRHQSRSTTAAGGGGGSGPSKNSSWAARAAKAPATEPAGGGGLAGGGARNASRAHSECNGSSTWSSTCSAWGCGLGAWGCSPAARGCSPDARGCSPGCSLDARGCSLCYMGLQTSSSARAGPAAHSSTVHATWSQGVAWSQGVVRGGEAAAVVVIAVRAGCVVAAVWVAVSIRVGGR